MASEMIGFRLNPKTMLRLQAIASEKGLSVPLYIKQMLENQDEHIVNDIKGMQTDITDIIHAIDDLKSLINKENKVGSILDENQELDTAILLEILLILRNISQPSKLQTAQKQLEALGLKRVDTTEFSNH